MVVEWSGIEVTKLTTPCRWEKGVVEDMSADEDTGRSDISANGAKVNNDKARQSRAGIDPAAVERYGNGYTTEVNVIKYSIMLSIGVEVVITGSAIHPQARATCRQQPTGWTPDDCKSAIDAHP